MKLNMAEIKKTVHQTAEYSFLKDNPVLKNNIILLGLGGSYAYGTNNETSDLDIRGIALNSKKDILLGNDFEQITDIDTDTVVYSFNKILELLSNCNPNTIELLGLKKFQYISMNSYGKELLANKHMFLSKKAIGSFSGYAAAQLRRLDNKIGRTGDLNAREQHVLKSIENAKINFPERYCFYPEDGIKLFLDNAINTKDGQTKEIFMNVNLSHYPLRDYKCMWNEMSNIVKEYNKSDLGKRNKNAIIHNKLSKHMMHLIRLYLMGLDILEKEEIITLRPEHDLLMDIRNGKYLNSKDEPTAEFFDMVKEYEKRLDYAAKNTSLPDKPDYEKINDFKYSINEKIIKNR